MSRQPSFRDLKKLSTYLDGELNAPASRRLEDRLAHDPILRAALDDIRQTRAVLRRTPQRRAPRNFMLSPQMVAKHPPMPRLVPVLNYASIAAALLLFFSFASGLGFGGSMSAPEPAMMEAPAGFNIGGASTDDMAEMPAAEEMMPAAEAPAAPAPAMEVSPEEPAEELAAESESEAAADRAISTEAVVSEPTKGETLAAEKALAATTTPASTPTTVPIHETIAEVEPESARPLLTTLQRGLLIAIVILILAGWIVRRATIAKWQKASK